MKSKRFVDALHAPITKSKLSESIWVVRATLTHKGMLLQLI